MRRTRRASFYTNRCPRENLVDPPGYPPTHRKDRPACTSVFVQPKHTFLALPKHLQKGMCYFGRSLTQTRTYTHTQRKTSCSCKQLSKAYSTQTTAISKRPVVKTKGERAFLSPTTTHSLAHTHPIVFCCRSRRET